MINSCSNAIKSEEFYKGKSFDFAGEWKAGARYFNDAFVNSFVVYYDLDSFGELKGSALLACKQNHISSYNEGSDSSYNQPHLKYNDFGSVLDIEPNDYWIFICGTIKGEKGKSTNIVENYAAALALATNSNKGELIFVENSKEEYVIIGKNQLVKLATGLDILKLEKSKVDKIDGKGLSTEDYTTKDKEKLNSIENKAQENIIETIKVNGEKLPIIDKTVDIIVSGGTPITIDSELSLTSENPVQNKIITLALKSKQEASSGDLETSSKEIIGAINEIYDLIQNLSIDGGGAEN